MAGVAKASLTVYLKSKIQYLSDRNPYSLRNVVSEKLQIPKAKTELFRFRYGKLLLIIHLKQKLKVSF